MQEAQGRRVGPPDVVEQQGNGRALGHVDTGPVEADEDGVLLVLAHGPRALRTVVQERGHELGGSAEDAAALLRCGRGQPLLEQLAHHPEGKGALELVAAGPENLESVFPGNVAERGEERGFSVPRGAFDDDKLPFVLRTFLRRRPHDGQFVISLDERHSFHG